MPPVLIPICQIQAVPLFTQIKHRDLTIQIAVLALLFVAALAFIAYERSSSHLSGIAPGFDFLWRSTGWDISFSFIPVGPNDPYWYFFLVGLINTVVLGFLSLVFATVIGMVIAVMRTSGNAVAELMGTTYVEVFRNIPLLLQVVFWYKLVLSFPLPKQAFSVGSIAFFSNRGTFVAWPNVERSYSFAASSLAIGVLVALVYFASFRRFESAAAKRNAILLLVILSSVVLAALLHLGRLPGAPFVSLPELKGLKFVGGMEVPPEFLACMIGISVYGSAYITEIIRAGFNSVDQGITEAGMALGLRPSTQFFQIRLPLAVRAVLPTLTNQYIWLLKATTVGIAVGFADFFLVVATSINQSGQTFQIIAIFMAVFLALNYVLGFVLNRVSKAIALKGTQIRGGGSGRRRTDLIPASLGEFRENYFGSPRNSVVTIVFGIAALWLFWRILDWAVINAVWHPNEAQACRAAEAGACWSVVTTRWRLIFFGLYPVDQQWRSVLGSLVLVAVGVMSCLPRFWSASRIALLWTAGFATFFVLMRGGLFGLLPVAPQDWGGLALTLFIFASVVVIGMPIALGLALLRRSSIPFVSPAIGGLIDVVRSLPLLSILFSAAVILPLALPEWLAGDKLYRVIGAFALFFASYQAENLRSGFQALSSGQEEAGKALGLSYWQNVFLVLLPQVFKLTLPPTINQIVITFKETSLIIIIGFFEILASGSAAFGTSEWSNAFIEVYVFIGLIYFVFVFSLSRYGAFLERRMSYG